MKAWRDRSENERAELTENIIKKYARGYLISNIIKEFQVNKQDVCRILDLEVPKIELPKRLYLTAEGKKRYELWKKLNAYQGDNCSHNFSVLKG